MEGEDSLKLCALGSFHHLAPTADRPSRWVWSCDHPSFTPCSFPPSIDDCTTKDITFKLSSQASPPPSASEPTGPGGLPPLVRPTKAFAFASAWKPKRPTPPRKAASSSSNERQVAERSAAPFLPPRSPPPPEAPTSSGSTLSAPPSRRPSFHAPPKDFEEFMERERWLEAHPEDAEREGNGGEVEAEVAAEESAELDLAESPKRQRSPAPSPPPAHDLTPQKEEEELLPDVQDTFEADTFSTPTPLRLRDAPPPSQATPTRKPRSTEQEDIDAAPSPAQSYHSSRSSSRSPSEDPEPAAEPTLAPSSKVRAAEKGALVLDLTASSDEESEEDEDEDEDEEMSDGDELEMTVTGRRDVRSSDSEEGSDDDDMMGDGEDEDAVEDSDDESEGEGEGEGESDSDDEDSDDEAEDKAKKRRRNLLPQDPLATGINDPPLATRLEDVIDLGSFNSLESALQQFNDSRPLYVVAMRYSREDGIKRDSHLKVRLAALQEIQRTIKPKRPYLYAVVVLCGGARCSPQAFFGSGIARVPAHMQGDRLPLLLGITDTLIGFGAVCFTADVELLLNEFLPLTPGHHAIRMPRVHSNTTFILTMEHGTATPVRMSARRLAEDLRSSRGAVAVRLRKAMLTEFKKRNEYASLAINSGREGLRLPLLPKASRQPRRATTAVRSSPGQPSRTSRLTLPLFRRCGKNGCPFFNKPPRVRDHRAAPENKEARHGLSRKICLGRCSMGCDVEGLSVEEQRQHTMKKHRNLFLCPYKTCSRAFTRDSVLQKHKKGHRDGSVHADGFPESSMKGLSRARVDEIEVLP